MSPQMIEYLQQVSVELCQKWQTECIEVNVSENHLHLVFRYAPQMQLSKFINNFKSVSSRKVRKEFEVELNSFYWDWSKGFWSDGYAIDSVSGNAASQAACLGEHSLAPDGDAGSHRYSTLT